MLLCVFISALALACALPALAQPTWLSAWRSGQAALNQGNHIEAEGHFEEARKEAERTQSVDGRLASAYELLARRYLGLSWYPHGERVCEVAAGMWERILGTDAPKVASTRNLLAAIYEGQGRFSEGDRQRERAFEILRNALGPEHPAVAQALMNAAATRALQGRLTDAENWQRQAVELLSRMPDQPNLLLEKAMKQYAEVLRQLNRADEAAQWDARAREYAAHQGALAGGKGLSNPKLIHRVSPVYSEEGRKKLMEGAVGLIVMIDEKGIPATIWLIEPLGAGLDEKAIEALRQWRFEPARREDGSPARIIMGATFNLRQL